MTYQEAQVKTNMLAAVLRTWNDRHAAFADTDVLPLVDAYALVAQCQYIGARAAQRNGDNEERDALIGFGWRPADFDDDGAL